jgi:hypothetical protein
MSMASPFSRPLMWNAYLPARLGTIQARYSAAVPQPARSLRRRSPNETSTLSVSVDPRPAHPWYVGHADIDRVSGSGECRFVAPADGELDRADGLLVDCADRRTAPTTRQREMASPPRRVDVIRVSGGRLTHRQTAVNRQKL